MSKTRNFSNNLIDLLLVNISVTIISINNVNQLFPSLVVTLPAESVSNVTEVRRKK
jgi:hypothetical protein